MELSGGGEGKQLSANEMYLRLFERAMHPLSGTVPCPVPCRVQDVAIRCQQQLLLAKVAIEPDEIPRAAATWFRWLNSDTDCSSASRSAGDLKVDEGDRDALKT